MKGINVNPALDAYQRMAVKPVSGTQAPQSPQKAASPSQSTEAAKVTISSHAREMAVGGQVNATKVAALQESIANGTFQVDSKRVAERMLDTMG